MKHLLLIGLGGFTGSIARYLVSKLNVSIHFYSIPIGTFIVNIIGSLLIGLLIGISTKNGFLSTDLKMFLMVGFCGGFTTFSSFTSENMALLQNGQYGPALIYAFGSILVGLSAVYLGFYLTSNIVK